ncbi:MAG TPA: hypothetical protein VFI62_01420, partial [Burkholderiales bacterium]|nr:hypothetical protein [Burkholderiales bacterium]
MSQRIVDDLEAIQIDEHHRQTLAVPLGVRNGRFQPLVKHRAIGQMGERIVHGDELHRFFGLHAYYELTDLATDGLRNSQQCFIRLSYFCVEKLHDAEHM